MHRGHISLLKFPFNQPDIWTHLWKLCGQYFKPKTLIILINLQ